MLMFCSLEQVMRPSAAFEYRKDGLLRWLLSGRWAQIVVTTGAPALRS